MTEELDRYQSFVESLLFLTSAAEIRSAVRLASGIQLDRLAAAFEAVGRSLRDEGRTDEYELLSLVREALKDELKNARPETKSVIESGEDLVGRALQLSSALHIRTLLRQHRALLTDKLINAIEFEVVNPQSNIGDRGLTLFCVAALISGTAAHRVKAYLMWAANLRRQGDLKKSERWITRAARVADELNDPQLQAMTRLGQVSLYRARRELDKAIPIMESLLETAIAKQDGPMIVSLSRGIAQCARDLGDYAKALDHLNQLVAGLGRMNLQETESMISALELRGLVKENMGRYDQGFLDYQGAHDLARSIGDRSNQFVAMGNMAASLAKRGLTREGLRRFRDILRTVESWGSPGMVASTHNNIGNLLLDLDRPTEALVEFGKALTFKLGSDSWGEAIALLGMGDAQRDLGRKEDAEMWYTMASLTGLKTGNVGTISMYASRIASEDEAQKDDTAETLEWALDLAMADRDRFHEVALTNSLAKVYVKRGNKRKAIELYQKIIQETSIEATYSPEHLDTRLEYASLLAEEEGMCRQAYDLLIQPLAAIEAELREVIYDERRAEIITEAIKLYGAIIGLLLDDGGRTLVPDGVSPRIRAFNLHESAKSRTFLSGLSDAPANAPANVPLDLVQHEAELLDLERSYQNAAEVKSETFRAQRLNEIRKDLRGCWQEMESFARDYVRFRLGDPYSYEELCSRLLTQGGSKIAFVSFFCEESRTTAFLLKHGQQEPRVYRCPLGHKELRQIASRLRRTFNGAATEFPPYPPIRREKPFQRSLDFLDDVSEQLLQFLPQLEDVDLLCIAPHGPLHLIPFQALRTKDGNYLASSYAVVYTPSLSTAVQILTNSEDEPDHTPSVLVAGISAAEDAHPEFFEQDAAIFDGKTLKVSARIGVQETSRAKILEALPQYDVIHLSCHGYFEELNALNSGLLLSDGHRKPPRDPWSLSIMERQRFLITVRDLLRVRLRADLVTLNACSTGLQGQRNAGDELDGFSRALLLSGSSAVIVALWNVDQESSLRFLNIFYSRWLDRNNPVRKWEALQQAQQEFLASEDEFLRHPYHWAPFALTGDWR